MSSSKVAPILALSTGTVAAGLVGYCFYFDYKRRNDPEFRKSLVKERTKIARAKEHDQVQARNAERRQIEEAIRTLKNDNFMPNTPEESEGYFLEQVSAGEVLAAQGPNHYVEAAVHLIKALKVYPRPADLLTIYQKTQPPEVMAHITSIFAQIQQGAAVRPGTTAGLNAPGLD